MFDLQPVTCIVSPFAPHIASAAGQPLYEDSNLMSEPEGPNFDAFRDCVFSAVVQRTSAKDNAKVNSKKKRQSGRKSVTVDQEDVNDSNSSQAEPQGNQADPSELVDFSDYLATEAFTSLPRELQELSYQALQDDAALAETWSLPLTLSTSEDVAAHMPGSVTESLTSYGLIDPPKSDVQTFMSGVVSSFIAAVTSPPPKWIATKASACEICGREWVPLTYHHLIPRAVHAKVLKRGWHEEQQLNSVAWLCRACHTFVHKMASNEELARHFYTLDLICERDDVQKWAGWVGTVRWKKR